MYNINSIKKFTAVLIAVGLSTFWIGAQASVPLQLNGLNPTLIQQEPITFNGVPTVDYAGAISGSINSQPNSLIFCVDLRNVIYVPGNYTVNLVSPSQTNPAFLQLSSPFNMEVAASMVNKANPSSFGNNTDKYTALQLAVWSVVYNWTPTYHPTNTLGTNSTLFSAPLITDSNILNAAYGFLSIGNNLILNNTYSSSYDGYKLLINSGNYPGHVTQTLIGKLTVPEPATYMVLAAFLLASVMVYKRKQLATSC